MKKIISGGQTGVDRGALDAALAAGFPAGGWCPEGRIAEDGLIPERYPLVELPRAGYRERTRRNVIDSDATLVIYRATLSGGTLETVRSCERAHRPVLLCDATSADVTELARSAHQFVGANATRVLNVAGPRESGWPGARACAEDIVARLIEMCRAAPG